MTLMALSNDYSPKLMELLQVLYGEKSRRLYKSFDAFINIWKNKAKNYSPKGWVTENDVMLITYADSIKDEEEKPLVTLNKFLSTYADDVITAVHILPMFPYTSDDGFSVVDYYKVDDKLGSWDDVRELSKKFDLMLDAVINHVSKSSKWFQSFLKCKGKYKNYFIVADPNEDYSTVIRPRALPLLTPFETAEGVKYLWTTFSDDQIDLNFSNPNVLLEVLNVILTYAYNGARFIRLDAVGFVWKKLGTTCMHLKETHAVVKLIRLVLDEVFPGTMIITETNVPHKDNISYFGNGYDEAHLVYQFPLPPLVLFSFITGNAEKLSKWAKSLESTPLSEYTTYFNFLASHDGIGLRPVEGILSDDEVQMMVNTVINHGGKISYRFNSDGSQSPYELNITYMDALTDPKSKNMQERVNKFIAAHAILLSLRGVPGIYIHSLLGSQNWYEGVIESGINRRINREKLNYKLVCREIEQSNTLRNLVFNELSKLIKIRRRHPAFSPNASQKVVFLDGRIFSFIRYNDRSNEKILVLVNVSSEKVSIPNDFRGIDIISDEKIYNEFIEMLPYQARWIVIE